MAKPQKESSIFFLAARISHLNPRGESSKLKAQSSKLKAQSSKLKAQSSKLKAQSSKLKAQSSKLLTPLTEKFSQVLNPTKQTILKITICPGKFQGFIWVSMAYLVYH